MLVPCHLDVPFIVVLSMASLFPSRPPRYRLRRFLKTHDSEETPQLVRQNGINPIREANSNRFPALTNGSARTGLPI